MGDKHEPQPKDTRADKDLELPEDVAEDVKGGMNLGNKQKLTPNKK